MSYTGSEPKFLTQPQGDNSTKAATTAYVDAAVTAGGGGGGTPASVAIAALDIDWSLSETFYKAISVGSTFTFSNIVDGKTITVVLTNATGTAYAIAFPATKQESGGLEPILYPASTSIYMFTRVNGVTYCSSIAEVV